MIKAFRWNELKQGLVHSKLGMVHSITITLIEVPPDVHLIYKPSKATGFIEPFCRRTATDAKRFNLASYIEHN